MPLEQEHDAGPTQTGEDRPCVAIDHFHDLLILDEAPPPGMHVGIRPCGPPRAWLDCQLGQSQNDPCKDIYDDLLVDRTSAAAKYCVPPQ